MSVSATSDVEFEKQQDGSIVQFMDQFRSVWCSSKSIVLIFLASRALVFLVNAAVFVAANLDPSTPEFQLRPDISWSSVPMQMWQRWDSNHYIAIASHGYSITVNGVLNTAYFPLYPLLGHLASWLFSDVTLSLLIVSNAAFLFSLFLLYKLARLDFDHETAMRTVLYISFFPFTIFFAGVFTESLFLLLLLAAFYHARTERWITSGFAGMFASATRLLGMAVLPALAWEYFQQRLWNLRKIDGAAVGLFLVPLGLLSYMTYNAIVYGDFLSNFHSTKQGWGGEPSWPWVAFRNQIARILEGHVVAIPAAELLLSILAVVGIVFCFRYLRTSYAILTLVLVVISFSNISLLSFCRYFTTMFPVTLLLARFGKLPTVHHSIMIISVIGLICVTTLFANGMFIG